MQFLIILVATMCFNGLKISSFFIAVGIHILINLVVNAFMN
jgi:hypothetical protein